MSKKHHKHNKCNKKHTQASDERFCRSIEIAIAKRADKTDYHDRVIKTLKTAADVAEKAVEVAKNQKRLFEGLSKIAELLLEQADEDIKNLRKLLLITQIALWVAAVPSCAYCIYRLFF